ncbi:CLUMA_CG000906, isoform A [Clunio marinus]|uniref:CLUMA_CG000906, isoform A n=1 Tax=Clunio marinus TaxID=568069 RepID=A0A1J1HKV0_9DIPT|nr:CLUMA_CG000906, isoform A [Clunio marinus]
MRKLAICANFRLHIAVDIVAWRTKIITYISHRSSFDDFITVKSTVTSLKYTLRCEVIMLAKILVEVKKFNECLSLIKICQTVKSLTGSTRYTTEIRGKWPQNPIPYNRNNTKQITKRSRIAFCMKTTFGFCFVTSNDLSEYCGHCTEHLSRKSMEFHENKNCFQFQSDDCTKCFRIWKTHNQPNLVLFCFVLEIYLRLIHFI